MKPSRIDTARGRWFRSANCDGWYGYALLLVCVALALLAAGGERTASWLRYDRMALADGQLWRLVSAHAVHLNALHAAANIAATALLWALFARAYRPRQWLLILGIGVAGIDAGLWWLAPAVQWYLGASGLLHTVWAAGARAALARRESSGVVLIGVLVLKLAAEQLHGTSLVLGHMPVVVDAHLYGALAGLVGAQWVDRGLHGGWLRGRRQPVA